MNFNELLSFAATNQKQAEKKLVHTKRYSTIVPPPKKDVKKVDTGAIKAILEKKVIKSVSNVDQKKSRKTEDSSTSHAKEKKISSKQSLSASKPSVKPTAIEKPKHKHKDHVQKHQTSGEKVKIPDKKDGKIRTSDKSRGGWPKTSEKIKERSREEKKTDVKTITKSLSAKKTGPNPPMDFSELMRLAAKKQTEPPTSRSESKLSTSNGRITSRNNKTDTKPSSSNGRITSRNDKTESKPSISNGKIPPKDKQSTRHSMSNGKTTPNSTNDRRNSHPKKITNSDSNHIKGKDAIRKTSSKVTDRTIEKTNHGTNRAVSKDKKLVPDKQKTSSTVPQNPTRPGGPSRMTDQSFNPRLKDKFVPPPPHSSRPSMPFKRAAMPPPSHKPKKRRRLDSDSDYEDDGFIDDSPMDVGRVDVSSYIKQIFGYDKNKYGYESDYSLRNMDASYSQIQKEEARSSRLGMQEDLEDIRKEKEEEQRKLDRKKKAMKSKK